MAEQPASERPSHSPDTGHAGPRAGSNQDHGKPAPRPGQDARPFIYAALDFFMAAIYGFVLFVAIPNRHAWAELLGGLVVLSPLVMGVAMLLRRTWTGSWWLGVIASAVLLVLALVMLALTLASAAFLAGVYGAFGRAASMLTLVAAALIIELVALLPAFQLKYLMTRAGRRAFGKGPPWA